MGRTAQVIPLENTLPREKWVKRIKAAWQEQLTSIFETGNLLDAMKEELVRGEWGAAFQNGEMPFSQSQANKLMAIADDDNLRNSEHVPNLPSSWGTLYALTKLTDEQFETGIKSGAINPKMQRKDVNALRGIEPKKKEIKPLSPKSLDDWCDTFSIQITRAVTELSKIDKEELLDHLRQTIKALEDGNV